MIRTFVAWTKSNLTSFVFLVYGIAGAVGLSFHPGEEQPDFLLFVLKFVIATFVVYAILAILMAAIFTILSRTRFGEKFRR